MRLAELLNIISNSKISAIHAILLHNLVYLQKIGENLERRFVENLSNYDFVTTQVAEVSLNISF